MKEHTIAAIATAAGAAGVAVVRLSGDRPLEIAEGMFSPSGAACVREFEPYRMYPGEIDCGCFRDFGLCVYFRAPHSFTGEDVVEFHCHGGVAIARGVLARAVASGARPATRGEFTRRAFLNGKLSLASAEGLIGMIESESEGGVRAGYALYRERLTRRVTDMQNALRAALAEIEANIDFPEEGLEESSSERTRAALADVLAGIRDLLGTYRAGRMVKSGVRVALVGAPNTGKSSLFNALVGYERAIVADVPGTTRDVVDGAAEIAGVRFVLSDTAGIRAAECEVERLGIERSEREAKGADIVLRVFDCSAPPAASELSEAARDPRALIVFNKRDLAPAPAGERAVSAKTGEGLPALAAALAEKAGLDAVDANAGFLTEQRHYDALVRAEAALAEARDALASAPLDLVAVDLERGWSILGEITGETASESIVSEIFSRFCVGK